MLLSELFESVFQNKWGYTKLQFAMIKAWGGLLYLDYNQLPNGQGNLDAISSDIDEYLNAVKQDDIDAVADFEEWFQEGAKKGGKVHPTKQAFDKVMHTAERALDTELVVYKTGDGDRTTARWISTTTRKGAYQDYGNETMYTLPKGTKVIFADGIADDDEVIIHTSELP